LQFLNYGRYFRENILANRLILHQMRGEAQFEAAALPFGQVLVIQHPVDAILIGEDRPQEKMALIGEELLLSLKVFAQSRHFSRSVAKDFELPLRCPVGLEALDGAAEQGQYSQGQSGWIHSIWKARRWSGNCELLLSREREISSGLNLWIEARGAAVWRSKKENKAAPRSYILCAQ